MQRNTRTHTHTQRGSNREDERWQTLFFSFLYVCAWLNVPENLVSIYAFVCMCVCVCVCVCVCEYAAYIVPKREMRSFHNSTRAHTHTTHRLTLSPPYFQMCAVRRAVLRPVLRPAAQTRQKKTAHHQGPCVCARVCVCV